MIQLRRIIFIALLLNIFGIVKINSQSINDVKLSKEYKKTPLINVVNELKEKYKISFSYLEETLVGSYVNCNFKNADWSTVKECLFKANNIHVKVVNSKYVILRPFTKHDHKNFHLYFKVINEIDSTALENATISYKNKGFYTSKDGLVNKAIKASENDSIQISFLGYNTRKISVNNALNTTIALTPTSQQLNSVAITEYLTDGINAKTNTREIKIQLKELNSIPGFSETDVFRSFTLLPGINTEDGSASNISIRGGSRDQTQILWDGINIYANGHLFGYLSSFSSSLIENIEVWRGKTDAKYGGKLSGVINMSTDNEIIKETSAGASINLAEIEAFVKTPLVKDKLDIQFSGLTSYASLYLTPTFKAYRNQAFKGSFLSVFADLPNVSKTFTPVRELSFHELNGKIQWRIDKENKLSLSSFYQQNNFDLRLSLDQNITFSEDQQLLKNFGTSFTHSYTPSEKSSLTSQIVVSSFNAYGKNKFGALNVSPDIRRNKLSEFNLQTNYDVKASESFEVNLGAQIQYLDSDYELLKNTLVNILTKESDRTKAFSSIAYGTFKWKLFPKFSINSGLRFQYYMPKKSTYLEPRIDFRYDIGTNWSLKGGYGKNHQFFNEIPEFSFDLGVANVPTWILVGDKNIPLPSANEYFLGVLFKKRGWLFEVEAYHKKINHFTSLNLLPENTINNNNFTTGSSEHIGIDFLIKKRWRGLRSWIAYSLSQNLWSFPEINTNNFRAINDKPHQLKWHTMVNLNRWETSLSWNYHTGIPYTPTELAFFIIDPNNFNPDDLDIKRAPINSARIPDFHRFDASIGFNWGDPKKKKIHGKISLGIINIFNKRNIINRSYPIQDLNRLTVDNAFFIEEIDRTDLGRVFNVNFSFFLN